MKNLKKIFITIAIPFIALVSTESEAQSTDKFSDPEIAAIAVAANDIDIMYAKIAKKKSNNEAIINFANTMISDHSAVIDKAVELVNKLGVKPVPNSLSEKLNNDASKTREILRSKKGSNFDKAYIKNEVAYHKAVINAIENVLVPDTQNEQLKDLLQTVLPALKAHLKHAQNVKSEITR
jgi:putative membrane protein